METVLVTGATGRLGPNLIKNLVARGYEVRAYVMPGDDGVKKLADLNCEIFHGNFLDVDSIDRAVKGCNRVLHMGCVMGRPSSMSELTYWNLNVTGTFALTRACVRHDVKRLVYASTDATYDSFNWTHIPMEEAHPQNPGSLYGMHKKCGEAIIMSAHRETGLPTVITRFASIMVADEILNFFTVRFAYDVCTGSARHGSCANINPKRLNETWEPLESAMRDDPAQLCIPRGRDFRSWRLHISDVRDTVDGVVLAMTHDQAVGEAFNIGYTRAVTWEEVARYIAQNSNRQIADVSLDVYWEFELSTNKARRLLGFNPKYGVKEMVDDALAFRAGEDIGVISGASYFA